MFAVLGLYKHGVVVSILRVLMLKTQILRLMRNRSILVRRWVIDFTSFPTLFAVITSSFELLFRSFRLRVWRLWRLQSLY